MAKTFSVIELAEEDAIFVTLTDGRTLRARDLLPEVVDNLGKLVDKRAREAATDEVEQRRLMRILTDEDATDDAYGDASAKLTELTTRAAQRDRLVAYEQLAAVFTDEDGKPLTHRVLQQQIPLPAARRIALELTRQILGREDVAGSPGNAEGSPGDPTPTGITA